jgi:hypothetical protein
MKGIDETPQSDNTHIIDEKAKEFRFVGRQYARRGQTLFEYDSNTDSIAPAKITQGTPTVDLDNKFTEGGKKVYQRPDCSYFWALNLKNAQRKMDIAKKEFLAMKNQENQENTENSDEHSQETDIKADN